MQFQLSDTLKSRTYIGLIFAQFLAAFNDQAIHASSMFYAIHQGSLTEAQAISLMPILFFAPWAIFCTLAGYLADRFSKRDSLVFWKIAEVGITLIALAGFWMGTGLKSSYGPAIVLSTVFLMGTHSAFFVPAKYGVMPEILQPQLLSKANGVLESTSFLAVILGTVSGGFLSYEFRGREYYIGLILVALAVLGAAASSLIQRMPAADPNRPFPKNLAKPLLDNLRVMLRSRPLALSVLGIAFFTFMVAFMRATMYMHGESCVPRWTEFRTSWVVGTVALGVGLGSYLAGNLSGGKVELGLVPLGAVGMAVAAMLASVTLFWLPGLIATLILIGFFSGFYIVPLYTLLQQRAPKASKGDLIATSNFINVTGAIIASLLFFLLVSMAQVSGIAPLVEQKDNVARGELKKLEYNKHGRPYEIEVQDAPEKGLLKVTAQHVPAAVVRPENSDEDEVLERRIDVDEDLIDIGGGGLQPAAPGRPGSQVIVSTYTLRGAVHYKVRLAGQPLKVAYDQEQLPHYLFVSASLMTLAILYLLCRQLPDFFVRALLWLRSHGRYRLKVVGLNNLPTDGPVILATNCDRFDTCMQVVTAADRFTRFILLESEDQERPPWLLRYLARRTGLVALRSRGEPAEAWDKALAKGVKSLLQGSLVGLTADGSEPQPQMVKLLQELRRQTGAPVLPVYCGALSPQKSQDGRPSLVRRMRVVIGHALPEQATPLEICRAIHSLGEWMHQADREGGSVSTLLLPGSTKVGTPDVGAHP
jgi:MFS family permease